MEFLFNNEQLIYVQIIDQIKQSLVSGKIKPGEKLLSVRELALIANVNPNTMQKALQELEKSGLIITNRTVGRYVSDDINLIKKLQIEIGDITTKNYLNKMHELGFDDKTILKNIKEKKYG